MKRLNQIAALFITVTLFAAKCYAAEAPDGANRANVADGADGAGGANRADGANGANSSNGDINSGGSDKKKAIPNRREIVPNELSVQIYSHTLPGEKKAEAWSFVTEGLANAGQSELVMTIIKHEGENAKVAVRNIRRDAITHLKDALKKHEIAEDDERRALDDMQKLTDRYVAEVDRMLAEKEKDLMAL